MNIHINCFNRHRRSLLRGTAQEWHGAYFEFPAIGTCMGIIHIHRGELTKQRRLTNNHRFRITSAMSQNETSPAHPRRALTFRPIINLRRTPETSKKTRLS